MSLTPLELERYDRQIRISEWGVEKQKKLKKAKVVIAGIGGLGGLAALYLTAAGIGKIVLIDKAKFELSNMKRQILGWKKDIGRFKVEAAKEKHEELNPETKIETKIEEITEENISSLIENANVVVDGMDNWKTRFILNKYCVLKKIPFVHAGVSEFHGQITTIMPGEGPCLRCILPRNPPEKEKIPVVGVTPALFASLQAMEAIKIIIGIGKPLVGKMLFIDGKEMIFETVRVEKMPDCPICGEKS